MSRKKILLKALLEEIRNDVSIDFEEGQFFETAPVPISIFFARDSAPRPHYTPAPSPTFSKVKLFP